MKPEILSSGKSESTASDSRGDLDLVRAQFDEWRTCHVGRRHIPDSLWAAAIGLLERYPISVVSQHLRLNSARLQQQQDEREQRSWPGKPKSPRTKGNKRGTPLSAPEPSVDFLQIAPTKTALPLHVGQAACSIMIERVDGSRLIVRLPADTRTIESVCASFIGQ